MSQHKLKALESDRQPTNNSRRSDSLIIRTLLFILVVGAIFAISGLIASKVLALDTFPNNNNSLAPRPAGFDLRTEVALSGSGVQLQARESDYDVFIPLASFNNNDLVTITLLDACDSVGLNDFSDTGVWGRGSSIDVKLYRPDGTQIRGTQYNGGNNGGNGNDCVGNNLVFNNVFAGPNFQSTPQYGPNFYYIKVVVEKYAADAGIKNYTVKVTDTDNTARVQYSASNDQGHITFQDRFWPSTDGFAWWNAAAGLGNHGEPATIQFQFAPDCTYKSGVETWLKWYGADDGNASGDQPNPISFQIINQTTGATVITVTGGVTITQTYFGPLNAVGQPATLADADNVANYHGTAGLGGASSYNAYDLKAGFTAGDTYLWRWRNVDHLNGIQIWMPFGDLDSTRGACANPPKCTQSATPGLDPWQPGILSSLLLNFPKVAAPQQLSYSITDPGGAVIYSGNNIPIAANVTTYLVNNIRPPNAGVYQATWTTTGSTGSCSYGLTIVDIPYFSIFGSDISAGGGYTPNCGASGVIGGWYDSAAANAGANTQFGAISLGQVGGFGSAQNDAGGPPNGLTFANTAGITRASPSQYFGGNFGGTHCLDLIQQPATNTPANLPVAVTALANGANTYTGNMTLTGGQIPLGQNVSLFVTGDVYINGPDITYQDAGGGWAVSANGTTNVPSFVLVASGNIYIDNSVGNLDGIYEAGGTIYTCGLNTFAAETPANMYANCGNQLTVHGSFIAKQVNLMRSVGTLEDATTGEDPRGGAHACANGPALPVCAGEVFDFSPEMYMSDPAILQQTNGNPTYNTVTSLPPVL